MACGQESSSSSLLFSIFLLASTAVVASECTEPDFGAIIHGGTVSQYGSSLEGGVLREADDVLVSIPWETDERVGDFLCAQTEGQGLVCFEIASNYQVTVNNVVGCDQGPCPGTGTYNEYVLGTSLAEVGVQSGDTFDVYSPQACAVSAVATKPALDGGYLVLDPENHPGVVRWRLDIIRRVYSEGGKFEEEMLEQEILPEGIHYKYIDPSYRQKSFAVNHLVDISGLDGAGIAIFTERGIHLNDANHLGPAVVQAFDNGLSSYVRTECKKTCISSFYAYNIQQYTKQTTGESRFEVERAFRTFDPTSTIVNPYYWYTKATPTSFPADPTALVTFQSGNNGNVTVYDVNGIQLVGKVYGHRKGLGVWGGSTIIATNPLNIGDEFCSDQLYSLASAISLMNNHGDFSQTGGMPNYPPLECIPGNTGGLGVHVIPVVHSQPWDHGRHITFLFCRVNGSWVPCEDQPKDALEPLNPAIVDAVNIRNFNELNADVRSLNFRELLVDVANGTFEDVLFTLDPGLYSFGFSCKDGVYRYGVRELTSPFEYLLTESMLLSQFDLPDAPSLEFDGADDYVEVANMEALNAIGSGDFTVEAWYQATEQEQVPHPTLLSNRPSHGVGMTMFFHSHWSGSAFKIPAIQLGGINYIWNDPPQLLDGTWHHFAVRKAGDTLTYFSDGHEIQRFSSSSILNASISAKHPLWIGRDGEAPASTPWNGRLDELRIWSLARSQDEIQSSMHDSLKGDESGLVASWSLQDGTGQTVSDATGEHHGRLGSTPRPDESDPNWVETSFPLRAGLWEGRHGREP